MRIVFRVDASTAIGSGHLVRCLTLAETLRKSQVDLHFICRDLPGDANQWLSDQGYAVTRLAPGNDWSQAIDRKASREALTALGHIDWLVVDHYDLDAEWETAMRSHTKRLLVIDDLANRPHDCDLLLDQNFRLDSPPPYGSLAPKARLLLGPRYALLRPEFGQARTARKVHDGHIRRVLVCFGGADPANHTAAALQALQPWRHRLARIDVILGNANPYRAEIETLCATLPQAHLYQPCTNMAELMLAADLAIGAGGTMNWERLCLGLPSLAIAIADNQRPGLNALLEAGYLLGQAEPSSPAEARLASWLAIMFDNPALMRGLAQRGAALVDGQGAERVADCLLAEPLCLRPATLADAELIFAWRNAPSIRAISINAPPLQQAAHAQWLAATLTNPQRSLLIAESAGRPTGVVRFDYAGSTATISVYRDPTSASAGKGLIRAATSWLRENQPNLQQIRAEVLSENRASFHAFLAAGYHHTQNLLEYSLETS